MVQVVNIIVKKIKEKKMKKLMALVAAMVMVTGYAYAGDWNFYGSSRVSTFWTTTDANTAGTADVDTFSQGLQGNARIGANVKVSDELTGRFEYGTGVNVRLLYGEWNFGGGTFLVGQTYSPLNLFYSNQVYGSDNDMLAEGGVYSGREAMLRLKFGDFQVAVMNPNSSDIVVGGGSTAEVNLPAIEAKYSLKLDPFSIALAGGYQTYDLENGGNTYSVDSYVIALGTQVKFGAAYVGGNIYTGQNPGNMISVDVGGGWGTGGFASTSGTTVLDNDVIGYLVAAGAKINDQFSVEFGYAKVSTELDQSTADDDSRTYYGQATITLAPGVFVVTEAGVIDYEEINQDEVTYVGAKWQINF